MTNKKEIRCSGLSCPHENFSEEAKEFIKANLERVEKSLIEKYGETNHEERLEFVGGKIEAERCVWAIESACTEEEFNQNKEKWVEASIMFNADSNYYYKYEKEW
jgi:hypothetical protein